MNKTAIGAVMMAVLSFAACNSSNDGGGGGDDVAGVDKGKLMSSLTTAEQSALCDWYAAQVGGYGAADSCAMVGISAPLDLADCLSGFPSCGVTVGSMTDCYTKIINAETMCTEAANMAALVSTECQAAAEAGCFD